MNKINSNPFSYNSGNFVSACLIVGFAAAFASGFALMQVSSPTVATTCAVAAGLWCAWPIFQLDCLLQQRFLHPPLRRYDLPLKPAAGKVRELLNDRIFHMRDRWHVTSFNMATRRLVASMSFSAEIGPETRPKQSQNLVEMRLLFEQCADGTTSIKYDFSADSEYTYSHCEVVIRETVEAIEQALGGAVTTGDTAAPIRLPAPSWALLGATAACAAWLAYDILQRSHR